MEKSNTNRQYNSSWPFVLDPVHSWAYWDQAFTKQECEKIVEIGNRQTKEVGKTVRSDYTRKAEISWLYPNEENNWVFRRMTDIVVNLNDKYFQFDIFGAVEGFQFTKYSAPNDRHGKHVDSGVNYAIRKLSFTLQLSDPTDYEGGELHLHIEENPEVIKKQQGYVAVFPSYTLHEVTPITKGTRYSLVSWITGKPFK